VLKNQSKEIRGLILLLLKNRGEDGASEQLIEMTLSDERLSVSMPVIRGHLRYLEEKGYIRTEEVRDRELDLFRVFGYLTAKGTDLLEGNIEDDPGIMVIR
jgi:predicted ArsR family transcriptional regulator